MLHRCDVRDGEGWRGGDRTDEAWERHENHGNRGSSWIAALGQHACRHTQDRRRLSRYMRRWLVERFFAWIQWQRRILVRWEYYAQNFLGFVQLACLVVLFRRF